MCHGDYLQLFLYKKCFFLFKNAKSNHYQPTIELDIFDLFFYETFQTCPHCLPIVSFYFIASSTATATATEAPTIGLLPKLSEKNLLQLITICYNSKQ